MQAGTAQEPVRYIGKEAADNRYHDGALRPVVGVSNYQVMRCNRNHPDRNEGFGWTYNHAPNLAHWNGTFYFQYLSNPAEEHVPPGQTLLVTSSDGVHWGKPQVLFPIYRLPDSSPGMMHQRMGFYVAPSGRLLTLGFVGKYPDPVDGTGIGRVVREIYKDGSFGPIYFIRYNAHLGWNEKNTGWPFYTKSPDEGFKEACRTLLADKLMTAQWWDEHKYSDDGFFSVSGRREALSFYHRKDGKVVGLWKWSNAAISEDEGKTWSKMVKVPTFIMDGAKFWGQRTKDGRYALVYNPSPLGEHRWPLCVVTGEDGITFDNMLIVHGEVPPRRFQGRWKDFGPQYIRGIEEGNGAPPGDTMWVCYSMNKEDMWVSRVPIPARGRVEGPVHDTFDDMETDGLVRDWNIYSPLWCPVRVVESPSATNKSLELQDKDPQDYARAARIFPESRNVTLETKVLARQANHGGLEIEVLNHKGQRPVRLVFAADGQIKATNGEKQVNLQAYTPDTWVDIRIEVNTTDNTYSVSLNGISVLQQAKCAEKVDTVERLLFRTGPYRELPLPTTPNDPGAPDIPGADEQLPLAVFRINEVHITPQ